MQPIIFNEYKEKIIAALESNGFKVTGNSQPAPEYVLVDGFINQPIYNEISGNVIIGGPTVPMVMIVNRTNGDSKLIALKAIIKDINI